MHVENGRKRVEITSSFSILPTDAEAKKEKNKTVENKEVELLFRRRRQWLRAGNPRNVFIFPILSFIRLVNFSGSFIKNKKKEKKKEKLVHLHIDSLSGDLLLFQLFLLLLLLLM